MSTNVPTAIGPDLNGTQRRKLRRLLTDAAANVPMYRELYASLKLTARDLADPSTLSRLPVLTKTQLLAATPEDRRSLRFDPQGLTQESTTGSTGQPFSLYIDRRYRASRNLRFLRGLLSAGYRPWQRLMLLTDRYAGLSRRRNWHYQSVEQPTESILEAFLQVRPEVLYGFTTPLRLLAEALQRQKPAHAPRLRLVVATAEMLDAVTRRTLENAFDCPVCDFYGMTEMGLVAWQRPGASRYIMSSNAVLTEFIHDDSCHGRYRMLMTNLDLRASPIIRFDSGDLALADLDGGAPVVTAFEGRRIDTVLRRDGSELSPYRITDAFRDVEGVRRFKVTQRELAAFDVDLEVDPNARNLAIERTTAILESLLGERLELKFSIADNLIPQGARKFRPVECRVKKQ